MDKLTFVAWLYVMALCGLFLGGLGLYEHYDYSFNHQDGMMRLKAPGKYGFDSFQNDEVLTVDVVYETPTGEVFVPGKIVQGKDAKFMQAGNKIAVRFSKDEPEHVYMNGRKPESGLVWFALGVVMMVTAIYAHRKLRQEMAG